MYVEADDAQGSGKRFLKARLISGRDQIEQLRSAGLTTITIDTEKGKDLPPKPVVIKKAPQPRTERLPPGRKVGLQG